MSRTDEAAARPLSESPADASWPAPPDDRPPPVAPPPAPPVAPPQPGHSRRKLAWWIGGGAAALLALLAGIPWLHEILTTVSTDDAYVNGHVTLVAPRVSGQVARVLVEDNNRVRRGDVLVQLDKEPFQVQVNIAQASVDAAQAELVVAQSQTRALEGQLRAYRFGLDHAIQDVDNRIALLRAKVATLKSRQAAQIRAQSDFDRVDKIRDTGAVSPDEVVQRTQALAAAKADVEEATQVIYQARASLGLPPTPENSDDLGQVPDDLDQTFSTVLEAQGRLAEVAGQLGIYDTFNQTPREMLKRFYQRDPSGAGDIDRIYAQILKDAPPIKQAETKLAQALRNLDQAKLNLRYADVLAEIDGVVTRRNTNPGNNVVVGQSLLAVRSLDEIWVDANFKETQLAELRIGQPVDLDVDMYGSRQKFRGRISGFTMGTGSTLALLPPENATGNFVKVVQRLPVRIDVLDYDPDRSPLFVGLSVNAKVRFKEQPTGPDAGKMLQPFAVAATSQPSEAQR